MPIDPKVLSTYLAMMQAKKLRDTQAQPDATRVATTPPRNLKLSSDVAAVMAISRFKQNQTLTPEDKYKNHIKIVDIRKVDATSGKPVTDTNNLTTLADPEILKRIIISAKKRGIDPYTALAMANQETGFGMERPENPFVINAKSYPNKQSGDMIENAMDVLSEKINYAKKLGKKDEAEIIQAWNGYGKIGKNFYKDHPDAPKIKSFYGVDVTNQDIDMNTNPIYGKRIIDIRENIIKKNPELIKLVNSIK